MREIKFRAWDKEYEEMLYQDQNTTRNNGIMYCQIMFDDMGHSVYVGYYGEGGCSERKNTDLMQFTGMKDSNGVEIYEGDIVKTESLCNDHSQKGAIAIKVVKFWCGSYHLCELNQDSGANLFGVLVVSRAEVIGNIYENPELLAE